MPEHADDTDQSAHTASVDEETVTDLPNDVAAEAARLTRLAGDAGARGAVAGPNENGGRETVPDEATVYRDRRETLLEQFGYVARVREEREGGATLVCYPAEWLDDEGLVRLDADLDTSRAVEISLDGPGEQGDFETAAAANDELVDAVREAHGEVHAANARAFADFMSNHYARPATSAAAREVREFLDEYYPRNAWPTDAQAAVVEESLRYTFEVVDEGFPLD